MKATQYSQTPFIVLFLIAAAAFLAAVAVTGVKSETENYMEFFADGLPSTMEYPPLAAVFFGLPKLISSTPGGYETAFAAEAFIFFVIGLVYTAKLAKKFNQSQHAAMTLYAVGMLLMLEFVLDRYDIFPAVLTLLAIYCYVTKRYALAWIVLSLATMTKLYPAILMPIFLIPMLTGRDWKGAAKGTALYFGVALAIFLPLLITDPDAATFFISYHSGRPLQIESFAASLIYPFSLAGATEAEWVFTYGSDNMAGPIPDAAAGVVLPIMAAMLLLLYAFTAHLFLKIRKNGRNTEDNRRALFGATLFLAMVIFMLGSKVFSGQYLIWIIPLAAFLPAVFPDIRRRRIAAILLAATIVLLQADFAVNAFFLNGEGLTVPGMSLILAKNLALLATAVMVILAIRERITGRNAAPDRNL
ncbi:MAG: DUF2029 domain-containing protein [Candidatus Methanoplasma sp.]|jgi:ABC-type multidrug transport system fused ATPase/permease subunit|nr:DUF2029 domain-containing protein [Candidatus Methanoplasma sp.]